MIYMTCRARQYVTSVRRYSYFGRRLRNRSSCRLVLCTGRNPLMSCSRSLSFCTYLERSYLRANEASCVNYKDGIPQRENTPLRCKSTSGHRYVGQSASPRVACHPSVIPTRIRHGPIPSQPHSRVFGP